MAGPLLAGEPLSLDTAATRHLRARRRVLGDKVDLFDGSGLVFRAEILELGHKAIVRLLGPVEAMPEALLQVTLVQALPVKLPRFETVVRQSTELGVARVIPLISARSELPSGGTATLRRRRKRWQRIAIASAEQCGRARVPRIEDPVTWDQLAWDALPRPRILLHPDGGALAERSRPEAMSVLIGPEGGFSAEELVRAEHHDARMVRLGPRILRADTAGPALLAIVQYRWGDLAEVSGRRAARHRRFDTESSEPAGP